MKHIYAKHPFDPSIAEDIKALYLLDNWHAPVALALDYGVIALAMWCAHWGGWLLYPLAVLVIGARQRALATMVHEAAHGTLARSKKLARLLATVFSGYLVGSTLTTYRASHVTCHHGHFGEASMDTDYRYMLEKGVYAAAPRHAYLWRMIAKPLLLGNVPSYIFYLIKARMFNLARHQDRHEALALCAYWIVLVAGAIVIGQGTNLLLFWVMPFLTSFQVIGWFIELAEHAPLMENRLDLYMTRNRHSHWLEHFLTGMHSENYHLAHHLQPRVPFWHMDRLHRILQRDPHYRRWDNQCGGIFASSNGAPSTIALLARRCEPSVSTL
jgi:fatty acid desaturase